MPYTEGLDSFSVVSDMLQFGRSARSWPTGSRRGTILILLAVCLTAASFGCAKARHVVLISVDTLRADHLMPYGYPRETSPHIASLAKSGVVFETAIAVQTSTGPSHATMLTGLYPPQHGATLNSIPIRQAVETLPERLRRRGIRPAGFISGVPLTQRLSGLAKGFDHYDEDTDSLQPASQTCERLRAWLPPASGVKSLFLFVHLFDPHSAYTPPEPFASRFAGASPQALRAPKFPDRSQLMSGSAGAEVAEYVRRYDGEIASADACVGELFALLRDRGYWGNTLVIVTADHGETLGERFWPFDHGTRVYDEQILVPLVLRLPDDAHAGRRASEQVHHIDIAPTILDFFDVETPSEWTGVSLLHALRAPMSERPAFSLARPDPGRVPELAPFFVKKGRVRSIRRPPYKLIRYPAEDGHLDRLHDLRADPLEQEDASQRNPEVVSDLGRELDAWELRVGLDDVMPGRGPLSPEDEKKLRSLGYID